MGGGGAPEAETAKQLREYAVKVGGREQLAIEAFADAMESIPLALAENAGLDPIDVMVDLRAKHQDPKNLWYGVDVFSGKVRDTRALNVVEPLRVKLQVVKSATEAASMILRIDDVIASKGMKGGAGGPPGTTRRRNAWRRRLLETTRTRNPNHFFSLSFQPRDLIRPPTISAVQVGQRALVLVRAGCTSGVCRVHVEEFTSKTNAGTAPYGRHQSCPD